MSICVSGLDGSSTGQGKASQTVRQREEMGHNMWSSEYSCKSSRELNGPSITRTNRACLPAAALPYCTRTYIFRCLLSAQCKRHTPCCSREKERERGMRMKMDLWSWNNQTLGNLFRVPFSSSPFYLYTYIYYTSWSSGSHSFLGEFFLLTAPVCMQNCIFTPFACIIFYTLNTTANYFFTCNE